MLTVQEWNRYRKINREPKFKARFKVTNYEPAMDDHCNPAVTNASLLAHKQNKAHRRNSDYKPLPDIIPKRRSSQEDIPRKESRYRSDSDSPATMRKKSTDRRKQSNDGDVSRTSDTDPSDRDGPGKIY